MKSVFSLIRKRTLTATSAATIILTLMSSPTQAVTIANGGFESPVVGNGVFAYGPTMGSWTFLGSSGISGNNSDFTNNSPLAPEGVQVGILQGTGSFSQQINFLTGGLIQFTFLAAKRIQFSSPEGQDFNVKLDGTVLGLFRPTASTYLSFGTAATQVSSGSHLLSFVGLNSAGVADTVFVDNVQYSISAVPEPATFTLLIGGFLALAIAGGKLRRKI